MSKKYPIKILVAWGEAISGNAELRNWLMGNGYPELGLFVHALQLDDKARQWLIQEGYPALMALCAGSEGDMHAVEWLRNHEQA